MFFAPHLPPACMCSAASGDDGCLHRAAFLMCLSLRASLPPPSRSTTLLSCVSCEQVHPPSFQEASRSTTFACAGDGGAAAV